MLLLIRRQHTKGIKQNKAGCGGLDCIPVLRKLKQEDHELKISLVQITKYYFNKPKIHYRL